MTATYQLPERVVGTTLESVKFSDGMVVTADDLDAAMTYPADMLQTVLRSYFGCGLVCGLSMVPDVKAGVAENYLLCINAGLAVDCDGFPVELCVKVNLDLTPDPCALLPDEGEQIYIAIRRVTSDEAPRDGCGCSTDVDDPRFQCSRTRNHTLVKAFRKSELDGMRGVCALPDPDRGPSPSGKPTVGAAAVPAVEEGSGPTSLCECLKQCPSCDHAPESWILLGCVTIVDGKGIVEVDDRRRRYVKPVHCACEFLETSDGSEVDDLRRRVDRLEDIIAAASTAGGEIRPTS
jgi:hypothetical protein